MIHSGVPAGHLIRTTALLAAPTLAALAALVWFGGLDPGWAVLAGIFTTAGTALVVRVWLGDLFAVRAYLLELARRNDAPPPALRAKSAADLVEVAARLWTAMAQRTEQAQTVSEAAERILDSLPDPLLLLDDQTTVVSANIAARRLLGDEIEGRSLATVLREPSLLAAARAATRRGEAQEVEFELPGSRPRSLLASVRALPEPTPHGVVVAIALHDVTTLKRSEQARADFVANASHELRTPLSTLIGFVETLRGSARDDPEARDRFLGIMHDQATRLSRLVDDLMSLSRIELYEHDTPEGSADLGTILRSSAEMLQLKAAKKSMTIEVDLPDGPAVEVPGDADQITQVAQNLLDNAIKYGRAGGTIRVRVFRDADRWAALSVEDEGEGIPPEHLPRLTERFYRVDKARSRELGGTGLGLAIVKHIVNRHRGSLSVESELGVGSTFTVRFPAEGVAAERAASG